MLVAFVVVAICGCGSSQIPVVQAKGIVTFNGQPLTAAKVVFRPSSGPEASGVLDAEGKFALSTYSNGDGAVIGKHGVYIVPDAPGVILTPGQPPKPSATPVSEIPLRYQSPETSGLEAEVTRNGPNEFTFELKK